MDLRVMPRYNIYIEGETNADLIVDAEISYIRGEPWDLGYIKNNGGKVDLMIQGHRIQYFTAAVPGKLGNVVSIPLNTLTPQMEPYTITVSITSTSSWYEATTKLFYLPEKNHGSVVKVDNLFGGLLYRNPTTHGAFKSVFPYGFYGDYSGTFNKSHANIETYVSKGFNVVNLVEDFSSTDMTPVLKTLDRLNLLFQYDMRHSYRNLSSVMEQIPLVKNHPSLLTWYTADEPDGWGDDLGATKAAYNAIAQADPYHPVALVLNCQNYHFREYTAGADIIMEDAYPIGINATYSVKWGTPCNTTLGDCGCDNCVGSLLDVPNRIDQFKEYGAWLGGAAVRKPIWAVPQAFGNEDYWRRYPTVPEVWAMDLLALNHGAKARLAWIYSVAEKSSSSSAKRDIDFQNQTFEAASSLAKVLTASPVMDYLTGVPLTLLQDGNKGGLDIGFWRNKTDGLLCIVNPTEKTVNPAEIDLPPDIWTVRILSEPWGSVGWDLRGPKLIAKQSAGLAGYTTSCVLIAWVKTAGPGGGDPGKRSLGPPKRFLDRPRR